MLYWRNDGDRFHEIYDLLSLTMIFPQSNKTIISVRSIPYLCLNPLKITVFISPFSFHHFHHQVSLQMWIISWVVVRIMCCWNHSTSLPSTQPWGIALVIHCESHCEVWQWTCNTITHTDTDIVRDLGRDCDPRLVPCPDPSPIKYKEKRRDEKRIGKEKRRGKKVRE